MTDKEREKLTVFFTNDAYAVKTTGIELTDARENYARCRFCPDERHVNAAGTVMGGALYTLADFTFAVASNFSDVMNGNGSKTSTLSAQISYLSPARLKTKDGEPEVLISETECIKKGRSTCCFTVKIFSEKAPDRIIAIDSVTGFTVQ